MSLQDNGSLHNSHQPLLLFTIIHHTAHNGSLIFIMRVTYTTPRVVMYSPENITSFGVHNQTHQMFSLSVVFTNKKKVRILCVGCQGERELSNHMSSVSSRMHLLSLGRSYRKGPADYSCKLKLQLTCSSVWTSKSFTEHHKDVQIVQFVLWAWISLRSRCQHRQPVTVVTFLVVYEPDSDPCVC